MSTKNKLLILTQKVDKHDDVLGFMHGWVEGFSRISEKVSVVCLESGEHDLPDNVEVFSLGKEKGRSRMKYIVNFFRQVFQLRGEYDTVFVHMNQEYVLLGGIFWRLMGKKVVLWRNHKHGNVLTTLAVILSHRVYCTSPASFTARYRKTRIMSVGVDTELFKFKTKSSVEPNSILFLGRISPVKRPHLFVRALSELKQTGQKFTARVFGDSLDGDRSYGEELRKMVTGLGLQNELEIYKGVPHSETVSIYDRAELYVNLTPSGSLDKTLFEAMSTGTLVLASNSYLRGKLPECMHIPSDNPHLIAEQIKNILNLSELEKKTHCLNLREYVVKNHSLALLMSKFESEFQKK